MGFLAGIWIELAIFLCVAVFAILQRFDKAWATWPLAIALCAALISEAIDLYYVVRSSVGGLDVTLGINYAFKFITISICVYAIIKIKRHLQNT